MPAPDDISELMQRLRILQLRLNSVDPGAVTDAKNRVLEWRSLAGDTRAGERRRMQLHSYVIDSVTQVKTDFGERLNRNLLPRLTETFHILVPQMKNRTEALVELRATDLEDDFSTRLRTLERYMVASDMQLGELRAACADSYKKLAEFTDRLDLIWADENLNNIGGWRVAIEKVRTEKEAGEKTRLETFRDEAFGDDDDEQEDPATPGLICPKCSEPKGRRQPRTGLLEDIAGLVGIAPFYCNRCMVRFYRYRPHKKQRH